MKKIFLPVIILLFAFNIKSFAQCPTGYTPMQVNIIINSCPYLVDLCIRCSPLGNLPNSVSVRGFMQIPTTPACVQTLTAQEVLQYIETYVSSPDYFYTYICPNQNGAPPCPDQSQPIEIRHFSCWQIEMIQYLGAEVLYYNICNENEYCYEKISWCFDGNQYRRTVIEGPTQYGTPSCTLEIWEINIPQQIGQTSECFIMHNACQ
jgi:hypothetical protein